MSTLCCFQCSCQLFCNSIAKWDMSVKHCVVEEEDSDMACRVLNGLQLEV